jgi:integrase
MLNLPVYLRGSTYYLHARVLGKQIKRSLGTSDKHLARLLAAQHLAKIFPMTIRKYEIDIGRGIYKSEGAEDHSRMMDALENIGKLSINKPVSQPPAVPEKEEGLRLPDVVEKFFLVNKQLKPATVLNYKTIANQFAGFIGNPFIEKIDRSDAVRWQEDLSKIGSVRTSDNKLAVLTTIFNFAKERGYYFKANPAANLKVLTKTQKKQTQFAIFEIEEIQRIYSKEAKADWYRKDRHFYLVVILALISGCRVSEMTSLLKSQLKENPVPHLKIEDSKTLAGIREVPIPKIFFDELMEFAKYKTANEQIFKYEIRLGKGSGNAVGQKFGRHLDAIGMSNKKLVFHSLRKFFNDFCSQEKFNIPHLVSCQMLGHEVKDINTELYMKPKKVDVMANYFLPAQLEILELIGKNS